MYNKEKDEVGVFHHWVVVEDICEPRKIWNNNVLRSKMIYSADPDFDFESFN